MLEEVAVEHLGPDVSVGGKSVRANRDSGVLTVIAWKQHYVLPVALLEPAAVVAHVHQLVRVYVEMEGMVIIVIDGPIVDSTDGNLRDWRILALEREIIDEAAAPTRAKYDGIGGHGAVVIGEVSQIRRSLCLEPYNAGVGGHG